MGSEAMVPEWASEPCIMGIDEAGRGPVLGPMVYGCLYCPLSYKKTLATLSFADSKTLKEEKREELFEALKGNDSIGWVVDVIDPKELSAKMLKKNKINLNEISHDSAMGLVDRVLKIGVLLTEVYIDTVRDPGKYEVKMSKNFPSIKFVVAKKADSLYPVVILLSVVQVTRDRAVRDWVLDETADNINRNFGSGYPADPATKSWLENHKHSIFGFPTLPKDPKLQDFLHVMQPRAKSKLWENDTSVVSNDGNNQAALNKDTDGTSIANHPILSDRKVVGLPNNPDSDKEEELEEHFSQFGGVSQVHLVVDKETKRSKGIAYIHFTVPDFAARALQESDNSIFQGRLLHVMPAIPRRSNNEENNVSKDQGTKTLKQRREEERKAAEASGDTRAWNSLFMRPDTIVENVARKYGVSKSDLLDREADDLAVRIALGETQVISETKNAFKKAGVNVEALEELAKGKVDGIKRSNHVILAKNLPYGATENELANMFGKFGSLDKIILPSTKTLALVVFLEAAEAKAAFRGLAYKRYKTLAQEYGGGAFTVSGDVVFFANYKDQRLYKQSISSLDVSPIPLTPDYGGPTVSYADGVLDTRFNRFIAVREDCRESSLNPPTTIVSIALGNNNVQGKNFHLTSIAINIKCKSAGIAHPMPALFYTIFC
ncbi:hypothetical protein KIW84_030316 [Lathyrus oleraceus]|uniref:Ribonuclease n=1 Tax=Pisum sativum TaxID=3888 RepID=A0A9D4XPA8_PEA|nr:hypothetical protein KIW84_030316 [Pisum sativum]